MKRFVALLLIMLLMTGSAAVALAKPYEQETSTPAHSTYEFNYDVPEDVQADTDITVGVNLKADEIGENGYDGVHLAVTTEYDNEDTDLNGNAHFEASFEGHDYDFDNNYAEDTYTFDLPKDYDNTTDWTLNFSEDGLYTITYKILDGDNNLIAKDKVRIAVGDVKDSDEEETKDEDGGLNDNTQGLLRALFNHLQVRGHGNPQARIQSTHRLLELLKARGLSEEDINKAIQALEEAIGKDGGASDDFDLLDRLHQIYGDRFETYINGHKADFDVKPEVENGRVLVPFRKVAEMLGAEVTYDPETKVVTFTKGDKTVEIFIGKTVAEVNGKQVILDAPAKLKLGRTLVPLRFLAESLDTTVDYYPEGAMIVIKPKKL